MVSDYDALFQPSERPRKFSAEEVGFTIASPRLRQRCHSCRHWFVNAPSDFASRRDRPARSFGTSEVSPEHQCEPGRFCEIMRLPDERNVPGAGVCRFWNIQDGVFPLLRAL
jgi:hypothetical protein